MKRACAVLLAVLCGCGRSESPEARDVRPVIGVSLLNLSNEFVVTLREAMEARAKELGVRLIVNDG